VLDRFPLAAITMPQSLVANFRRRAPAPVGGAKATLKPGCLGGARWIAAPIRSTAEGKRPHLWRLREEGRELPERTLGGFRP